MALDFDKKHNELNDLITLCNRHYLPLNSRQYATPKIQVNPFYNIENHIKAWLRLCALEQPENLQQTYYLIEDTIKQRFHVDWQKRLLPAISKIKSIIDTEQARQKPRNEKNNGIPNSKKTANKKNYSDYTVAAFCYYFLMKTDLKPDYKSKQEELQTNAVKAICKEFKLNSIKKFQLKFNLLYVCAPSKLNLHTKRGDRQEILNRLKSYPTALSFAEKNLIENKGNR